MFETLALFFFGILIGCYGTMVGIGGGPLVIPVLLIFYNFSTAQIIGTSLLVVFANTFFGTLAYVAQKRIDFISGTKFAVAAIPGAIISTFLVDYVPLKIFSVFFAVFLLLIAAYIFLFPHGDRATENIGMQNVGTRHRACPIPQSAIRNPQSVVRGFSLDPQRTGHEEQDTRNVVRGFSLVLPWENTKVGTGLRACPKSIVEQSSRLFDKNNQDGCSTLRQNLATMGTPSHKTRTIIDAAGKRYVFTFNEKYGILLTFVIGILSTFLGIGGGMLQVPALAYMLSYPIHIATATSHYVTAINSFFTLIPFLVHGDVVFKTAVPIAAGALIGAQFGAGISVKISSENLLRLLVPVFVVLSIKLLSN